MRSTLLVILSAVSLIALGLWFNALSQQQAPQAAQYQADEVDYQITGFDAVIFDQKGQATQKLSGEQLKHFPFDDHHEIENPKGQTLQGSDSWKMNSDSARSAHGLGELHWQGDVHLQQSGPDALEMQTDYLLQKPREQHASTDQGVVVNSSLGTIKAQAMQLNTKTSQLTFKGQVNGVYQTQNP